MGAFVGSLHPRPTPTNGGGDPDLGTQGLSPPKNLAITLKEMKKNTGYLVRWPQVPLLITGPEISLRTTYIDERT